MKKSSLVLLLLAAVMFEGVLALPSKHMHYDHEHPEPEPEVIPESEGEPEPEHEPEPEPMGGLMTEASKSRLSTLVSMISEAQLYDTLENEGPFTILAPHDDMGFLGLDSSVMDLIMTDPEALKSLLTLHVIPGRVKSCDIEDGMTATTLNGKDITFSKTEDGMISVEGSTVMVADVLATNGYIHIIDEVLVPEELIKDPGTIMQVLEEKKAFGVADLIEEAGLNATLSGEGEFVMFAPTDIAVMRDLGAEGIERVKEDLQGFLLYHVLEKDFVFSNDLLVPTLSEGNVVRMNEYTKGGMPMGTVNGIPIIRMDIPASNGRVHLIDGVLMRPAHFIYDLIAAQDDLKTLATAIASTGIDVLLNTDGSFTVFAPTDSAFDKLPEGTLDSLLQDTETLATILQTHVLGSVVYKIGVMDGEVQSLGGGMLSLGMDDMGYMVSGSINGANITSFDLKALNGVIHKIDSVLLV